MPIHRILQDAPLGPFEIERMIAAYDQARRLLGLTDSGDAMNELIARKIVEVTKAGVREPAQICAQALKQLGVPD